MSYLLAYYGDDFTGSTDVLEVLSLGGVPTVLFLAPPSDEHLAAFPDVQAVGIAGISRSLKPEEMELELPPIFEALKKLCATYTHYKICSTFDSSPRLGSIGKATELSLKTFPQRALPLVVGAPALGRFVAFGNLFASVGAEAYRLDRHPTMSRHPTTPMTEADVRRHLAAQTELKVGLVDVLMLERGPEATLERMAELVEEGRTVVLFDTLNDAHLLVVAEVLETLAEGGSGFVVGSSGVEYALTAHFRNSGRLETPRSPPSPGRAERIIVMSGSAAPATTAQLDEAERQGFKLVRIDVTRLLGTDAELEHARLKIEACAALSEGRNVALYSAHGPDDRALSALSGEQRARLGSAQGALLRDLVETFGVRRVCVAGGDTCGYAARQLSLYALEFLAPLAPGSPLCRGRSSSPLFDGLELSLKAGQVGRPDYFISVLNGH
ncbi:four-carbon acid sugar kinase family protein [soil metagenome]